MSDDTTTTRRGSAVATRSRILDAATELFYANGIRGSSADRIIEMVGITKVTFYRHFRTKTELVVAYLERQAAAEKDALERARSDSDGEQALSNIADLIGTASCMPGFRGCPFINAAAETPDPDDPVRIVVANHRQWTRDLFAGIATDLGAADPEVAAGQFMMLRDGAMVGGYLGDESQVQANLQRAYLAIAARS